MKISDISNKLKADIIELKNNYSNRIEEIIDGANGQYTNWNEKQFAIDDCLNRLRKLIWESIEEKL